MALVGDDLYVANTDAIVRFPYQPGETRITAPGAKVVDLPGGPINHHWTKNIIASRDGSRLYATVGSNSNVGENGMANEEGRAAIWEVDPKAGAKRLFATGLRNPNGMAWEPETNALVDGRQRARRARQRPRARLPDVGARRRLLRLAVQLLRPARRRAREAAAPRPRREGDRARLRARPARRPARPRVARRRRAAGAVPARHVHRPARLVEPQAAQRLQGRVRAVRRRQAGRRADRRADRLSSNGDGKAHGRPVGVAIDKRGALLVADDVGNTVWRVAGATNAASAAGR